MRSLTSSLNKKGKCLLRPAKWLIQFPQNQYSLSFEQGGWSSSRTNSQGDLKITTTPEIWATVFTSAPRSDRSRLARPFILTGLPNGSRFFPELLEFKTKKTNRFLILSIRSINEKNQQWLKRKWRKKDEGINSNSPGKPYFL